MSEEMDHRMSEMIERVAREAYFAFAEGRLAAPLTDETREIFRRVARAAIAAMREPTLDMVLIGHNAEPLPSMRARPIHYKHAWQAMIDEALR